jgi:peptidoglycan/LPS O-acetylase OafA/YrhL
VSTSASNTTTNTGAGTSMERHSYRRDIDGLRAIAVLAVFLDHLDSAWVPGGYTGVDIFFVISGFLITSMIYGEVLAADFSVRRFYKRRINRLLPALLLVIATTTIASAILLSPADLVLYAQSAFTSLVGVSNVFFWQHYGNYFGNTREVVLLHTWTLGVEEQFYVLWPALMLLVTRFFRKHLVPIALAATVLALIVSEIGVREYASASYYLLPTRFFELAIGGTLAFWLRDRGAPSRVISSVAGIAGFILLAAGFALLNSNSVFPGVDALIPCLGAALLIFAGTDPGAISARILALRPMVFIGLLSYSMYLWHWPVITLLRYVGVKIDLAASVLIIGSVIALSWLTWKFVEVPFRRDGARLTFGRVFQRRFLVPATIFLALAVVVTAGDGFPSRFKPIVASLESMTATHPEVLRAGCHVPTALYATQPSQTCRLGDPSAPLDGILLGDSYANHFTGMVDVMARTEGLAYLDYTMDACPPIPGYVTTGQSSYATKCLARNDYAFTYFTERHFKRVILAAEWPDDAATGALIDAAVERALGTGAQVTVILANPLIPNAATCPIRDLMYGINRSCTAQEIAPPTWAQTLSDHPGVTFISPSMLICSNHVCDPMLDGVDLYRDDGHLNDVGSRLLGTIFESRGVRLEPKLSDERLGQAQIL